MGKKSFLLSIMMLLSMSANSYTGDVVIDGVCYYITTKDKKAEVKRIDKQYRGDLIIPSTIKYEGVKCDVTYIQDDAFSSCQGLTSLTIPNSITSLGSAICYNCKYLTSITFPNNLTKLSDRILEGCSSLSSVTIPSSVTSIGDYAFKDCI